MTCSSVEPPIGIEPMTYALREARDLAAYALAAPIAPIIALMALAALGLSDDPVHEPVHARDLCASSSCYLSNPAEGAVMRPRAGSSRRRLPAPERDRTSFDRSIADMVIDLVAAGEVGIE